MNYKVVFSRQAAKDAKKIAQAGLKEKPFSF
jgi:mRNA-degrading endonuclease RelE of RelBE toxin-antitoxin system